MSLFLWKGAEMDKPKEIVSLVVRINNLTINIEKQTINLKLLAQEIRKAIKDVR